MYAAFISLPEQACRKSYDVRAAIGLCLPWCISNRSSKQEAANAADVAKGVVKNPNSVRKS